MTARATHILICDDDQLFQLAVKQSLKTKYTVRSAYNGDEAVAILRNQPIDLVLLDIQMRSPDEGLRYIKLLKEVDPDIAIVMTSGLTDFVTVKEAMRLGASDYIPKDFNPEDLLLTISQVLERRSLLQRTGQQNSEVLANQKRHVLVGQSAAIQNLRKTIQKIRDSDANVVITGETGTGKEVVARQLRKELVDGTLAPFVSVDSSTIQHTTAESTLFGHEKGAFTGADRLYRGVFEEANGGAVYFDEIANMPLDIQAKLLRVIQEKEVVRLGSTKPIQLEFRVICATNKDLETMARQGQFKDDLLQRLNVIPVALPPLRERREDVPFLLQHFAEVHGGGRRKMHFGEGAVQALSEYAWPGNIRELSNLVAYVGTMAESDEIELSDLPPKVRDALRVGKSETKKPASDDFTHDFYGQVGAFEKEILSREYGRLNGNISKLAIQLGMDRSHLYTKLKQFGLHGAN